MKIFEGEKKKKKTDDDARKRMIHIRDPLFFSDRKNIKIERSKKKKQEER